ncbi:hypothetical protein ACLKA6_000208 [Drosophila palustris]
MTSRHSSSIAVTTAPSPPINWRRHSTAKTLELELELEENAGAGLNQEQGQQMRNQSASGPGTREQRPQARRRQHPRHLHRRRRRRRLRLKGNPFCIRLSFRVMSPVLVRPLTRRQPVRHNEHHCVLSAFVVSCSCPSTSPCPCSSS